MSNYGSNVLLLRLNEMDLDLDYSQFVEIDIIVAVDKKEEMKNRVKLYNTFVDELNDADEEMVVMNRVKSSCFQLIYSRVITVCKYLEDNILL